MLTALTLNRRRWMQAVGGGVASAALPSLGAAAPTTPLSIAPQREDIAAAIVQSHARTTRGLAHELAQVLAQGRRDLVCFPHLDGVTPVAALQAIAGQARGAGVHVAVSDALITPGGDILSGPGLHQTGLGTIAFVPTLFKPSPSEGADMLLHLSAQPVSFTRAQALALEHHAHLIAATPVGDAFLQATGSVIFSPVGEVLAAAGAAWTQTLSATLRVRYWQDAQAQV